MPAAVRPARGRPEADPQSRRLGARPVPHREARRDAGAGLDGAGRLLDSIDATTPAGLRDRALIGLRVFNFARTDATLGMKVEDV